MNKDTDNNNNSIKNVTLETTTTSTSEAVNKNPNSIGKNKAVALNLKEEKEHMRKYIVLERYFGAKSKQTQYNCLGSELPQKHFNNIQDLEKEKEQQQEQEEQQEITIESLSLNKKDNVVDKIGVYRDIYCMDAIKWLEDHEISPNSSVITSLPDITEVSGMSLEEYKNWFTNTVALITSKLSENNVAIVYQTDIKRRWKMDRSIIEEYIDKGYLAQKGAESTGCKVIWHKIMTAHNNISNNKSSFTHMLCFAKSPQNIKYQDNTPDINPRGSMVWSRAMGLNACVIAILYCRSIGSNTIIDPFCGKGSVLAVSNVYGMNAIGVDLSTGKTKNSFNLLLDVDTVNKFDTKVWQQSNNNKNNTKGDDDDGENGDDKPVVIKKKVKKPKSIDQQQQKINTSNN